MNADTSLSPRCPREILREYICRPTEIQNEYFCRPTEIQIEYFCRGQRHWSTSYYTDFRCQSWTWNQCPNMGNDVRGRERLKFDVPSWRRISNFFPSSWKAYLEITLGIVHRGMTLGMFSNLNCIQILVNLTRVF